MKWPRLHLVPSLRPVEAVSSIDDALSPLQAAHAFIACGDSIEANFQWREVCSSPSVHDLSDPLFAESALSMAWCSLGIGSLAEARTELGRLDGAEPVLHHNDDAILRTLCSGAGPNDWGCLDNQRATLRGVAALAATVLSDPDARSCKPAGVAAWLQAFTPELGTIGEQLRYWQLLSDAAEADSDFVSMHSAHEHLQQLRLQAEELLRYVPRMCDATSTSKLATAGLAAPVGALEQSQRAMDDLLQFVTHDVRGELAIIGLSLAHLQSHGNDDGGARQRVEQSIQQVARLLDVLDEAPDRAWGAAHQAKDTSVKEVVADVVGTLATVTGDRGQRLVVGQVCSEVLDQRLVAPSRLALQNLLLNASKYSPAARTISVSARVIDAQVVVRVADEGLGFDENQIRQLFRKFSRPHAPLHGHMSTGLGLYYVRRALEQVGGTIEASSAGLGCGSTFEFRIPLAGATPEP